MARFTAELMVSGSVWGSVFPSSELGLQCTGLAYNTTPCMCYGGAARRVAVLGAFAANRSVDRVAIDSGEYFTGRGLFWDTFRGNASSEFFRAENYDAFALGYRDLAAFVDSDDDPLGDIGLSAYLDRLHTRPVVTNLNVSGTRLEGRIQTHALVNMSSGRRFALLAVTDPVDLLASKPLLATRLRAHHDALHIEMARLRALPGGTPELVVLVLPAGKSARRLYNDVSRAQEYVRTVVREVIGLHVVIVPRLKTFADGRTSYLEYNWCRHTASNRRVPTRKPRARPRQSENCVRREPPHAAQ
jgi:hypothetical protein